MAKKWNLTDKRLKTIKDLAKKGCTEATIARQVNLHPNHFSTIKERHPEIVEAINDAKASAEDVVVGKLWKIIMNEKHPKHFPAICFYAKTQLKWRETEKIENNNVQNFQGYSIETINKQPTTGNDDVEDCKNN